VFGVWAGMESRFEDVLEIFPGHDLGMLEESENCDI
jgi:hypothetical protein